MQASWDCKLSEIIKIQNRHRNESTNKGNVKPTMLTEKERKRERERKSTSGDSVVFNKYFPSSSVPVI